MDTDDSQELRRRLQDVVRMRGLEVVAAEIPARRETIWRFLSGRTGEPCQAVREGIERVIDDADLRARRLAGKG